VAELDPRARAYTLAEIGLDRRGITERMGGAPVLNCRTGGVWGVVLHDAVLPKPGRFRVVPFHELEHSIHSYLPVVDRTNSRQWLEALVAGATAQAPADEPNLLLRLYIPAERLYAAEASRLLSLFREWLSAARGLRIRQAGYRTTAGELIEFFAEDDESAQPNWQMDLTSFSSFLAQCITDSDGAIAALVGAGLGPAASATLVDRFAREARRLELDMRHERERRLLSLRQLIEAELLEAGASLDALPHAEIAALVDSALPGSSAAVPLALLAGRLPQPSGPVTVLVNPQFIEATQSTVYASVTGNLHLAPEARELLSLVERYGGDDQDSLQSAVYELEDADAPKGKRQAAKARLKGFLGQLGQMAKDVGTDLLTKYLENKGL
jgi:hypothetical protein